MSWFQFGFDSVQFLYLSVSGLLVSTAGLFLAGNRIRRGHWLFSLTYLGGSLLAGRFILSAAGLPGVDQGTPAVIVLVAGLVLLAITGNWNAPGQVAFVWVCMITVSFLMCAAHVTFFSHLGPLSLLFSSILLVLEILALALLVAHTFEVVDVLCRLRWRRPFGPQPTSDYFPMVSLHVPAHNEPPDMVIQTLDALSKLEYPRYEVLVIDNNTSDEELWRPVETHCRKLGFSFFHLENWPGFKSGALNYGLRKSHADAEIIGVVDADYLVSADYLKDLVGYFRDPQTAFVQTPQDYREFSRDDKYARACYLAYRYFFAVSMATRNECNGIIFGGTMGLIRRKILEDLGGWDEWCITEDAEISLRILNKGYNSIYVDRSYGRGLMPLNYEGLKKQRFRWAFGGMQIMRLHWGRLMPWSRRADPGNQLTPGQKFAYLSGGLQWLNDPVTFAFTAIVLLSGVTLSRQHTIFLQPLAGAAIVVPFVFILFGITKFLWALRVRAQCSLAEAWRAFLVLLSMTWTVTLACFLGLTRREGVFLRTPKQRGRITLMHSLRIIDRELVLGLICILVLLLVGRNEKITVTTFLLLGLLAWQSFIYNSAVAVSIWSYRSELSVLNPSIGHTSRTTGERFRNMATDRKAILSLAGITAAMVLLFDQAVVRSPDIERIYRTNPDKASILSSALVRNPPESYVAATIHREERAALQADVDGALALWSPDGVIRDENFTPRDSSDDRVWRGLDQIRRRYKEEFRERKYLDLEHRNISSVIEGDEASLVNDLKATMIMNDKLQKVFLSRDDRWVLRQENGEWKIAGLTINRAPR
ncbi:MAG: glycosyltransferase [candidate division Zixibacteria bacterium]|nr:glycosyltransferase [candidate division Zixibacteria bacterium]